MSIITSITVCIGIISTGIVMFAALHNYVVDKYYIDLPIPMNYSDEKFMRVGDNMCVYQYSLVDRDGKTLKIYDRQVDTTLPSKFELNDGSSHRLSDFYIYTITDVSKGRWSNDVTLSEMDI